MRVNRGLLGWGVFFIVVGLVPLAVRNGAVDASSLDGVFGLWPLILVGIGLGLLLADTRAAVLGGLLVAVTAGLLGGALMAGATGFGTVVGPCGFGGDGDGEPFEDAAGSFSGDAEVVLSMRCGTVEAAAVPGTGWALSGSAGRGLEPQVRSSAERLEVTAPVRSGPSIAAGAARWTLTLPDGIPMAIALDVDAGSGDLALDRTRVTRLDVSVNAGEGRVGVREATGLTAVEASVNAGSLTLDLPAASIRGRISVNAGSAEVCVPEGAGLRVWTDDVSLGSTNLAARGLEQQGSTWTTTGFTEAAVKVELDVSVNLGSFTLNPEGGCG